MKKYFFTSDIHSFFTPLVVALEKKGFEIDNPEHILVILGDVFDRGFETKEVYNFLKNLPDERLILIRGNHELLYLDLLSKSYPDSYDFHNGTVRTFCQIAGFDEQLLERHYWYARAYEEFGETTSYEQLEQYSNMPYEYWRQIKETVAMSDITKWLRSKKWVNYFETEKYICVHSWIPMTQEYHMGYIQETGYREDWRNATQAEWSDATWGCPWKKAMMGLNNTNKTIMCGHWHTSDFFNHLTKQRKSTYECPIFKSKKYKLIGLDACTAGSGKINILVLNEDEL